jgi:hypothetical protein
VGRCATKGPRLSIAEQEAQDVIIDDRDASYDRKVSVVHSIDP